MRVQFTKEEVLEILKGAVSSQFPTWVVTAIELDYADSLEVEFEPAQASGATATDELVPF